MIEANAIRRRLWGGGPGPSRSVTIVSTCMGRLSFLERTLPTWIRHTPFRIVVVDYSCPDGVGDWIEGLSHGERVSVVRCPAQIREERRVFNAARARNAGAAAVGEGFILFLDSDTELASGFSEWVEHRLEPDRMLVVQRQKRRRWGSELGGAILVHALAFNLVGGFDEDLCGWGTEDTELKVRLSVSGLTYAHIPDHLLSAIHHSSGLRVEHHIEKDIFASQRRNQAIADRKMLLKTGQSYSSWLTTPRIRRLLTD